MGFFTKWFALKKAEKEEVKHIVTEEELKKDDTEFKEKQKELNKILAERENKTKRLKMREKKKILIMKHKKKNR